MMNKAMDIDYRDGNERAVQAPQPRQLQQAPYDLHAVDLIAVNGRGDEQARPRLFAVDHLDRHGDGAVGVEPRQAKLNRGALACGYSCATELKWRGIQCIQPFPRVRVLLGPEFFSINSMMVSAISLPVALSMPSRPGDELTSITTGP